MLKHAFLAMTAPGWFLAVMSFPFYRGHGESPGNREITGKTGKESRRAIRMSCWQKKGATQDGQRSPYRGSRVGGPPTRQALLMLVQGPEAPWGQPQCVHLGSSPRLPAHSRTIRRVIADFH